MRYFAPQFGIGQSRHTRLVMLTVRDLNKNKTVPVLCEGQKGHNTGQKGHNTGQKGHNTGQNGLLRVKKNKTRPFRTKGQKGHLFGSVFFPGCAWFIPFKALFIWIISLIKTCCSKLFIVACWQLISAPNFCCCNLNGRAVSWVKITLRWWKLICKLPIMIIIVL